MSIRTLTSEVSGISNAGRTVGFDRVAEIMRSVVTSSILNFITIVNLFDSYYIRNRIHAIVKKEKTGDPVMSLQIML